MIVLWLLAAHMVGDYVLQTRWQAAGKFTDAWLRTKHVATYTFAFAPVAFYAAATWRDAVGFLAGLYAFHFLTDSRHATVTLGDWIAWRIPRDGDLPRSISKRKPLPPSPWGPLPILIDQSLHLVQMAVLGSLFLR